MTSSERLNIIRKHLYFKTTSSAVSKRRYRYTLDNNILTEAQRGFYEEKGFLVIPNLVNHELLDRCNKRFIDFCDGRADKGNITMMKDISNLNNKAYTGQHLYYKAQDILYDDVFQDYFLNDKMLDVVEAFTGPDIKAMHSMLINKPPDTGALSSRHPHHQDLYYFPFRPADLIVASWTAMEDVNEDNGCLFVLPGSHKGELYEHEYPDWEGGVNKAFHGIRDFEQYPKTYLPMAKGETVFFHPLLIHGSGYNKTKGFRKAISGHFASSECHYIDVKGTLQENISTEIEEIAAKRGIKMTIQDIWTHKSRLVRGRDIHL